VKIVKRRRNLPSSRLCTAITDEGEERFRWTDEITVEQWEAAHREHVQFEFKDTKDQEDDLWSVTYIGLVVLFQAGDYNRLEQMVDWVEAQRVANALTLAQARYFHGLVLNERGEPRAACDRYLGAFERQDWTVLRPDDRRTWAREGIFLLQDLAYPRREPEENRVPKWMLDFALRLFEIRRPGKRLPRRHLDHLEEANELLLHNILMRTY
jgi:hypothetical protein